MLCWSIMTLTFFANCISTPCHNQIFYEGAKLNHWNFLVCLHFRWVILHFTLYYHNMNKVLHSCITSCKLWYHWWYLNISSTEFLFVWSQFPFKVQNCLFNLTDNESLWMWKITFWEIGGNFLSLFNWWWPALLALFDSIPNDYYATEWCKQSRDQSWFYCLLT